jgi:predicted small secreted protein
MGRLSLALICLALSVGFAGCETIKGAGKDIEKAGEAIQRAAK